MNKNLHIRVLIGFLAVLMAVPPRAFAQNRPPDRTFRQEELDQMLAPIALYPDSLLAQILVAATYPVQVTEARRWVQQNGDLRGEALNNELDRMDWDLSVKALVPFPQVLAMMDDKLAWTERLGDAFLAQQADVMDTVQRLRARAQAEGNLKSTPEQTVMVGGESIEIVPADPEMVYVPWYDPAVVYGTWWYPAYPPYAWYPYFPAGPVVTYGLFGFAAGIAVASAWNWGWGHWDWGRRDIDVNVSRNININRHHIDVVRTTAWSREPGRRGFSSSRAAVGYGNRPSAAAVMNGFQHRQSSSRSNQAEVRMRHGQARTDAGPGRVAGNRRNGANLTSSSRNSVMPGRSFTRGNRPAYDGSRFTRSGTGAPRTGGAFVRDGSNRAQGNGFIHNADRPAGGGFGRAARGGGGGRHCARC